MVSEARRNAVMERIRLAKEGRYLNAFLFVCSYNKGRSPTCEHVARLKGFLADSAGSESVAVRILTLEAIERAEAIVCMEECHEQAVLHLAPHRKDDVQIWHIPDVYGYCAPELIKLVEAYLRAVRGGPSALADLI